jgi:hypothetical protein
MKPLPLTLVTGASSGIGRELALGFARRGYPLVLTARSVSGLEATRVKALELGSPEVEILPEALNDPAGPLRLAQALENSGRTPGILVNNAGFGLAGSVRDLPLEEQLELLQVNVVALVALTVRLLPGILTAGNDGGILNVASTAAYQPGPYLASYYASKAFVLSWSEALAVELRGKTRVSCLCPGPVHTGFQERARLSKKSLLFSGLLPTLSAEKVAEAGIRGLLKGRSVVVPGFFNRAGSLLVRILPRGFVARVVARLHAPESGS